MGYYDIRPPKIVDCGQTAPDEQIEEDKALAALDRGALSEFGRITGLINRSDTRLRNAFHKLACYFRREFHYDFVPYDPDEADRSLRGYIWISDTDIAIGGCCFRRVKWENAAPGYLLTWVWFHPYERRQGHLTRIWPFFETRFSRFSVDPPYSEAMTRFLQKHGNNVRWQRS